jgi:uncharacterized protein DUF6866
MTEAAFDALLAAVRSNCLLSDARYAQEQSLCNYLLAMREYYRWERQLPLEVEPPRAEVLPWIAEREAAWEALPADARWCPIPLGEGVDPFRVELVNAELVPLGLVYGAGVGRFGKPHFFLGELVGRERRGEVEILECGRELARDIDAVPAVLQDATIYLRREALERWLWLRAEVWESRENAGAMGAALAAHGFADDRRAALARLAEGERETLILHELGEHAAGRLLGEAWERLMEQLSDARAELAARAVRDLLADCLVTLPALLERGASPSLHFWFANFTGLRRMLFPRLTEARAAWIDSGRTAPLEEAVAAGRAHWERVAIALAAEGPAAAKRIAAGDPSATLA